MWNKKQSLRDEYDCLLSDMLHMQYRVEVFRRKMQVAESSFAIGNRLQTSVDDVVSELVKMSNDDTLAPQGSKDWWKWER
jgi:hypothetical protein